MKNELTIEESARLIELGVDAKLATLSLITNDRRFTLADILTILPREIYCMKSLTIASTDKFYFAYYGEWSKEYIHSTTFEVTPMDECSIFKDHELIDALNKLLIWCLTENKINLKSVKR